MSVGSDQSERSGNSNFLKCCSPIAKGPTRIHCFEAVDVLLFLVAVSEYVRRSTSLELIQFIENFTPQDQTLFEDETASRLVSALVGHK